MNFGRMLVSLMQVRLAGTGCEAGVGNWQGLILGFVGGRVTVKPR